MPKPMRLQLQGDSDESAMALGQAYVVYRRTDNTERPLVFFGVEDDAMSLYPSMERAMKAQEEASTLRGFKWRVGAVVWGWGR